MPQNETPSIEQLVQLAQVANEDATLRTLIAHRDEAAAQSGTFAGGANAQRTAITTLNAKIEQRQRELAEEVLGR
jgi:hypothetical protein